MSESETLKGEMTLTIDTSIDVTKEMMCVLFDLSRACYLRELKSLRNKYGPIFESELIAIRDN